MEVTQQNLKRFRDNKELVSIRRDRCDDRKMQAFVLHYSDALVLLRYVYDFHLDGLLLFRMQDISSIETSATDDFQRQLLIEEGLFDEVGFGARPPISSYDTFLRSLPEREIVILEDELADDPDFIMGRIISVDDRVASVRCFSGVASWFEEPASIEIEQITSCQTGTNYIHFYARHFTRSESQ
jgi:hypothetical protein